jgi:phosphoribosylformylglycinamidine synthase
VTTYAIEVRATSERYDVLAQQVAREILQLPILARNKEQPLHIRTAQVYLLTGDLSPQQIDLLTSNLLIDPVTQSATISENSMAQLAQSAQTSHIVDVYFHPGVTDTLAESILTGAKMLGISGLQHIATAHRYFLDKRLSEQQVQIITESLLYNPVIQHYILHESGAGTPSIASDQIETNVTMDATQDQPSQHVILSAAKDLQSPRANRSANRSFAALRMTDEALPDANVKLPHHIPTTIPISSMNDDQLLTLSKQGLLALNLDEMQTIQRYYRELGREPTDVELETLAQTWSEHCSHKTFRATIHYRELDSEGNVLKRETIPGLLKHYIMSATHELNRPWVVSAFSDNAGIIRFTDTHDLAFKVETHNHPSAIEPFGGANTGVGGVIRDVLGVSAQPIACTDVLCFGPPDTPADTLPEGVLPPRRIASGVVNGVRDYGNKMGIPTVNGAILYNEGYIYNPLVFCGCLGILPHGSHPHQAQPGDLIVVLGGRTGRDGIHGATFSSGEMSSEINAQAGSAVQIGAPITEKKVTDVILQARDRQLYHAITDCGAGGFSSAIGEMAAEIGAHVELEKAPLKYQGLQPWEIWLSEAQERMVLAVPPEHLDELLEICAIEEVEASLLGTFTNTHRLVVTYNGQTVADLSMDFLHSGRPNRALSATWTQPSIHIPSSTSSEKETLDYSQALLRLLSHPTIASKESVVRRYDHEVQGATILKPLVGRSGNGPGDAAVLQPILEEPTRAGIVLSNGINPLYGAIDPYEMALNAVDEALRNLTAVGGDIDHAAILDNFCWGNPNDSAQLGMLVRAVQGCHDASLGFGTPFISGKDSLNNEYRSRDGQRLPVIPTLLISAVSVIENAAHTIDMSLQEAGNLLYILGITRNELSGSHFAEILGKLPFPTSVPRVDLPRARFTMQSLGYAIRAGMVASCHDLSEGGLAVAAAEMSLAGLLGMSINISHIPADEMELPPEQLATALLFSESPSRFLLEIEPDQRATLETFLHERKIWHFAYIGRVTDNSRLQIRDGDKLLIDLSIEQLQAAWKGASA